MISVPRASAGGSIRTPGSGSTRRTSPSGNNGDAAIATTTATTSPTSTAAVARTPAIVARPTDVMPRARSSGPVPASVRTIRTSAWATINTMAIPATNAKSQSVFVYGLATRGEGRELLTRRLELDGQARRDACRLPLERQEIAGVAQLHVDRRARRCGRRSAANAGVPNMNVSVASPPLSNPTGVVAMPTTRQRGGHEARRCRGVRIVELGDADVQNAADTDVEDVRFLRGGDRPRRLRFGSGIRPRNEGRRPIRSKS